MTKAIIFDLDGTLLDTALDIRAVLNASLKKFGLDEINQEDTNRFIGNGAKKLVERAVGDHTEKLGAVYADYSVNFAECDNALTSLYPGEAAALKELKSRGIKLAVLTNKPMRAALNVCGKYLSEFKFDIILGQTDKFPLKPDPAAVGYILDLFNVKAEECLFVGDGETDVETARAAGIKCVSALWGYRSKDSLSAAGAENFAGTFVDILKFI